MKKKNCKYNWLQIAQSFMCMCLNLETDHRAWHKESSCPLQAAEVWITMGKSSDWSRIRYIQYVISCETISCGCKQRRL